MKRRIYTLIFIACDYLSITKIVKEGLNIFTYAYVTLLLQIKRKNPYIYQAKVKKSAFLMVWARQKRWHLRNLMLLNEFAKLLYFLIYTYYAWLGARNCSFKVQDLPWLWGVFFHHTFGLTISSTRKLFLCRAMDWFFI